MKYKRGIDAKTLISVLQEREYSLSELEKLTLVDKRTLIRYLKKIERICKRKGWKFRIKPAFCKKCGFRFEKSIKIPSKCPRCKSEWIEEPRFKIEA